MQHSEAIFALLMLTFVLSLSAVLLLIKPARKHKTSSMSYKVGDSFRKAEITRRYENDQYVLDPFELKLLNSLLACSNEIGLSVKEVNEILNLNKLSKENQRQRRHIVIKEINLKLYLITGAREAIIRVSSETDRRVKYYNFIPNSVELSAIKELTLSHS